jgi:hypothetical protein
MSSRRCICCSYNSRNQHSRQNNENQQNRRILLNSLNQNITRQNYIYTRIEQQDLRDRTSLIQQTNTNTNVNTNDNTNTIISNDTNIISNIITTNMNIPELFLDPISFSIMTNPVITPRGITYDECSIINWLKIKHRCPITKTRLLPEYLIPNRVLKDIINKWINENNYNVSDIKN